MRSHSVLRLIFSSPFFLMKIHWCKVPKLCRCIVLPFLVANVMNGEGDDGLTYKLKKQILPWLLKVINVRNQVSLRNVMIVFFFDKFDLLRRSTHIHTIRARKIHTFSFIKMDHGYFVIDENVIVNKKLFYDMPEKCTVFLIKLNQVINASPT